MQSKSPGIMMPGLLLFVFVSAFAFASSRSDDPEGAGAFRPLKS